MGPSGEIRAVDSEGSQSSVATLETGDQGLLLGITVLDGVLYAANGSGQQETHGVWRVDPEDGEPERIASLSPDESMPNGIMPDPTTSDALLVSDHLGGAIWRVTTERGRAVGFGFATRAGYGRPDAGWRERAGRPSGRRCLRRQSQRGISHASPGRG